MGQLIYFIKKKLNWKERTIDAPKTFPIQYWEQGVTTPPNYLVALISRVMKNDGYISNDLSPVEIDAIRQTKATLAIEQLEVFNHLIPVIMMVLFLSLEET